MRFAKPYIKSLLKAMGYAVIRVDPTPLQKTGQFPEMEARERAVVDTIRPYTAKRDQFPEMEAWERAVVDTIRPYTTTTVEQQWAFISALKYVHMKGIAGDIVDCGVWKGGNLILAGLVGQKLGSRWQIWGYDTYEGMSEPCELDIRIKAGRSVKKQFTEKQRDGYNAWCYSPLEDVSSNIKQCGLDLSNYRFVKGKCEESLMRAENLPDKIAVLRLGTAWYESTSKELEILFPRLANHGVLIFDDYGHWVGARKAVDEYFRDQPILMNRIDYRARSILKG